LDGAGWKAWEITLSIKAQRRGSEELSEIFDISEFGIFTSAVSLLPLEYNYPK
jgi:hypothetical protein